ncbi:uncharacterized protein [Amphiura filiformis]|uniref:uncharacterized protein n=1 Tax=Amphiura filiformis TaxID=82378 RepID=UPI003B218AAE
MISVRYLCLVLAFVVLPSTVYGCSCRRPTIEGSLCRNNAVFLKVKVTGLTNDGNDYLLNVWKVFNGPRDLQDKSMTLYANRNSGSLCGLENLYVNNVYYLDATYNSNAETLSAGLCNFHRHERHLTDEDVQAVVDSTTCEKP